MVSTTQALTIARTVILTALCVTISLAFATRVLIQTTGSQLVSATIGRKVAGSVKSQLYNLVSKAASPATNISTASNVSLAYKLAMMTTESARNIDASTQSSTVKEL